MVRRHDYRHTYVNYLSEHIQFLLVDIGKHKRENGWIYWILPAIKIRSIYAFSIQMYRTDTSNMTKAGTLLYIEAVQGQIR